jgi:hypothetical protein
MQYEERRTSLFNVIRSIVPARSSTTAIKGIAFSEYLSSLRQISISEGFRISQGVKKMRKGRYMFMKEIKLFSVFRMIEKVNQKILKRFA